MLAIANALDGMSRAEAARLVGLERQGRAGAAVSGGALQRRRAGRLARPAEAGPPAEQHAVLVLDQAGWHGAKALVVPDTITLA